MTRIWSEFMICIFMDEYIKKIFWLISIGITQSLNRKWNIVILRNFTKNIFTIMMLKITFMNSKSMFMKSDFIFYEFKILGDKNVS